MAIKKFDSQQWLAEHGYESSYSGSSSKATSTTSTGLKIFDSNQWLSDHGYEIPKFTDYSYAPKIDYLQELQNNENEIQTLKTGFGYEIPDTTDGLGFWEGVKSIGQYIQGKWNTGFGAVIGALGEAPDMASKAFNNLYGTAVVNPIRKVLGLEAINTNISTRELLRNASTEALGYLGLKPVEINTENIQNKAVKQFLDDAQSGKNPFAEHYYRLSQQYNDYSAPILTELEKVKTGWGKVTSATAKYGGMIAESQPQSLLYAIPQAGAILGTTSTYSRNLRESYKREDLTGLQQTTMGMELAAVDAYSELVFGLFGEAAALFKGATASAIKGTVKPTVGKLIASVFLTGAEESLEEMIAYPFQKYVEWRYSNGGKPVEQYSSYLNAKEFGDAAITGFLSGALFAGGQIAIDKVNQKISKPIVDLGADLASTPVDELSKPENIAKVESYVNAVADAQINNPEIFTVKSEFEMPSVTPDTIGTQPMAPVVETAQKPIKTFEQIMSEDTDIDTKAKDIDEWVKSDEGKKEAEKYTKPEQFVEQIFKLKKKFEEIKSMPLEQQRQELLNVNLQLLAQKNFIKRLENIPEGMAVSKFLKHFIPDLSVGMKKNDIAYLESLVSDDILFHEIIGREEVIRGAEKIVMSEKVDDFFNRFFAINKQEDFKQDDIVAAALYLNTMKDRIETGEDANQYENYINGLTEVAAKFGRGLYAFKIISEMIPSVRAENLKRQMINEGVVKPEKINEVNKKTNKTKQKVNAIAGEVAGEVGGGLDKRHEDATKEPVDEVEPPSKPIEDIKKKEKKAEDSLSAKILSYLKDPKEKPPVDKTKEAISILFGVSKQTLPDKDGFPPPTVFEKIQRMVQNRTQWEEVYEKAKIIVKTQYKGDKDIIAYLDAFAKPDFTEAMIKQSIAKIMKENGTSINKIAHDFVYSAGTKDFDFKAYLRSKFPQLSASDFKYVYDYIGEDYIARFEIAKQNYIDKMVTKESEKSRKDIIRQREKEFNSRPYMQLKNKIKQTLIMAPPEIKTDVQFMVEQLFKIFKQDQQDSVSVKTDVFDVIARASMNRKEYLDVFQKAKNILSMKYKDNPELLKYFNSLVDITITNQQALTSINNILKESNTTIDKIAKEFILSAGTNVFDFRNKLKEKLSILSEEDFEYIYNFIGEKYIEKFKESKEKQLEKMSVTNAKKAQREIIKQRQKEFSNKPSMRLKESIKALLVQGPPEVKSDMKVMLDELLEKVRQDMPKIATAKMDVFDILAKASVNRKQYGQVFDEARRILSMKYKDNPELATYFNLALDPVLSRRTMDAAIKQILKENDVTMTQAAKQFVLLKYDSTQFIEWLKNKLPNLDTESMDYLVAQMAEEFETVMENKAIDLTMQYEKSLEKTSEEYTTMEMTIRALQDYTFYNGFRLERVREMWARRMGVVMITEEMDKTIQNAMSEIARIESQPDFDPRKRDEVFYAMIQKIFNQIPASKREQFNAMRRFAMLFNLRTHVKNGTVNIVSGQVYGLSDRLAIAMGKSKAFYVDMDYREYGDHVYKRGENSAIEAAKKIVMTASNLKRLLEESSNYSIASWKGVAQKIFPNEKVDWILKLPYKLQEGDTGVKFFNWLGDQFMFKRHFEFAFENRLNALGYNDNLDLEVKRKMVDEAAKFAKDRAIVRTFRQLNKISETIKYLRSGQMYKKELTSLYKKADQAKTQQEKDDFLNEAKIIRRKMNAVGTTVDMIAPFVLTPAALVKESYKFSPVALASSMIQFTIAKKKGEYVGQTAQKLNNQIAQATVGTAIMSVIGLIAQMMGVIDLEPPEDEKEKAAWEAEGRQAYSLYIPGVGSFSFDWAQPLVASLVMGASAAKAFEDDSSLPEQFFNAFIIKPIDALVNKSIIDNITRQVGGTGRQTYGERGINILTNGVFQNLPVLANQITKVFDNTVRDVYDGSAYNILVNRVFATTPFTNQIIKPKYDIWGRPLQQTKYSGVVGFANRFVMNMLSPFGVKEDQMDTVTKEVVDVYKNTSSLLGSAALPSTVGNSYTVTSGNVKTIYTFTGEAYEELSMLAGKYQREAVEKIISKPIYASQKPEVKAKAFDKAYSDAVEKAKKEIAKKYPDMGVKAPK